MNNYSPYCACAVAVRVGADVFKYTICHYLKKDIKIEPCDEGIIDVRTKDKKNFNVSVYTIMNYPLNDTIMKTHYFCYLFKNRINACKSTWNNCYKFTVLCDIVNLILQLSKIMLLSTVKLLLAIGNVNYFWSIKNSSEVIEKLRLRNFRGSHVSSFDFSTLYTSLPHDLIKAKVLSLVNWCFNRESKNVPLYFS